MGSTPVVLFFFVGNVQITPGEEEKINRKMIKTNMVRRSVESGKKRE